MKKRMRKVISHELGHWIVTRDLGLEVGEIYIKFNLSPEEPFSYDASSRSFPYSALRSISDVERHIVNRGTAAIAGVVSQIHFFNGNEQHIFEHDAIGDCAKIKELFVIYRCIKYPNELVLERESEHLNEFMGIIRNKAKKIIVDNEDTMNGMITGMFNEASYSDFKNEFSKEWLVNLCELQTS